MIKIDKSTHLMILFTFALVFITVYLYYVISDIRKLQAEVKRINEESESRKQVTAKEIESLTTVVMQLSKNAKAQKSTVVETVEVPPVCVMPQVKEIPVPKSDITVPESVTVDDNDSVVTEDIRETLNCDSDSEYEYTSNDASAAVDISSVIEPNLSSNDDLPSVDDIQSLKYEELKDLCKTYNLSTKGNKEAIMNRVRDYVLSKSA